MRTALTFAAVALLCGTALAAAPDISDLPPHPRLWIGGVESAAWYIDPDGLAGRAKTHARAFALLGAAGDIEARALAARVSGDEEKLRQMAAELKTAETDRGSVLAQYALAFDWIASALPDAQRKEIARHLGDLAEGPVTRHDSRYIAFDNNALRRDMGIGLAALAIAGDDPRASKLFANAHRLFEDFIGITGDGAAGDDMPGRGAFGGGWPEGHDYDRHGSRYAMIYFLGLRSATGVDVFTGSPFWKAKPLYHIYEVLPNGHNVLGFQDDDHPQLHRYDREVMLVLAREFKDPHARWYLNHVQNTPEASSGAFEFLFDEPEWPERDFSDLPKAHYIPGNGLVIARSGWGENDTYVAFIASDWFIYHQNNAENVFAIYRNAPLAVKDGVYDGDVHTHYVNYSIRTVAYNGITVFDPAEEYPGPNPVPVAANDGGQMIHQWQHDPQTVEMWRTQARRTDGRPMRDIVDWIGFETTDTYTYAAGEAGRAYKPGKVPFFSRQLLFIYPNWIVVFDRVTAGYAGFPKTFHLHAPEEMRVSGREAVVTTRTTNRTTIPGRLFVKSLLPLTGALRKVEGPAAYRDQSWPSPREPYNDQFVCTNHLEITASGEKTHFFLTAMYACDADVEKAPEAKIVEDTPEKVTLTLGGKHTVTFNKAGAVAWRMQ